MAGEKVKNNWVDKVCIECTNGAQVIQYDNFSVTQTGVCLESLSLNKMEWLLPELKYGMIASDKGESWMEAKTAPQKTTKARSGKEDAAVE